MSKSPLVVAALLITGLAIGVAGQQGPQPTDQTNAQYRNNPCRDPWISYGFIIASSGTAAAQGAGDAGECNCNLYSNCRWGNFDELAGAIRSYRDAIYRRGISLRAVRQSNGQIQVQTIQNGSLIGSQLVAAGGGNIIAANGTNLVAAGGGNLQVSNTNPANLVAAGGGNLRGQPGVVDVIDLPNGIQVALKKSDAAADKKDEKK